jgi:PAS domain S-box-containing protein
LPSDVKLIWNVLKKTNPEYEMMIVETKDRFTAALTAYSPDIILADHTLPSFNSHEALAILQATGLKIPFILITGTMSEGFAVDVIKRGANDYILKDRLERLPTAIHNILDKFRLEKERHFFLEEVINNEKRYRALIENISDAIILINEHSLVLYQSPSVERLIGFTGSDLRNKMFIDSIHPDDQQDYSGILKMANEQPGVALPAQYRVLTRNGHYIWTEGTITNLLHDTSVKAFVLNYRDVTQSRQAEEKIVHANRLYAVLSRINKTIVHVTDEQTLFDEACKIAVTEGKFMMAWIGIPDTTNKKVRLTASCGASPRDLQMLADYTYHPDGPFDKTLRNGKYHVINDIQQGMKAHPTRYIRESGFNSGICLAIKKSGKISYILTIYSAEVNFFDPEEITLLVEATNDLSFALKVFEKDRLRTEAEEKLKANELALVQAEFRYRQIVETAQEGIWLLDDSDTTIFVNKKMCEILEYSQEEMIGKTNYFFMDEKGIEGASASMARRKGGISENVDLRYITKSGRHIWASVSANPIFDTGKKYKGALAMLSDITEKKKLEALLIKSNTMARIGNWELDLLKNTLYWSEITRMIHETDPDFIPEYDKATNFYKPGASIDAITQAVQQAIKKGTPFDLELQIITARSKERWVRCIGEAEFVNGACIRLYGSFQDIDERKKAEIEILTKSKKLAASNAELEQFAYVASHDLQEPLRMVTGFLTQIETRYGALIDEKGKQYIHFAVDGARRMRQIIMDLLEFSRIGSNRDNIEEIDLKKLMTEIVLLYSKIVEETHAKVLFKDLTIANAYRVPLFQIFRNLIGNALKYQKGDCPPVITISSQEMDDHWQYSILDNGIGIPEECFGRIFILFQRLHNNDEYSGTGMGLAICRKHVEIMGGAIWLHSEEGKGSNFFFTIPKQL